MNRAEIAGNLDLITGFSVETMDKVPDRGRFREFPNDLKDKVIFLERIGGIGDVIMLLPFARYLKEKEPSCRVCVGVRKGMEPIIEDSPDIDWCFAWNRNDEMCQNWDYRINFKGVVEFNKKAEKLHSIDAHFDWVGINPDTIERYIKTPRLVVKESAKISIDEWWDRWNMDRHKSVVMLQLSASSTLRSWDPEKNRLLAQWLTKQGVAVILVDQHQIYSFMGDKIYNCCAKFSIAEWMALVQKVDLAIGPDSGLSHVAGGLEVPFLGLYGSFSGDLRLRYYKNSSWIQANGPCVMCFKHHQDLCKIRSLGPSSPCMESITTSMVIDKITTEYKNLLRL